MINGQINLKLLDDAIQGAWLALKEEETRNLWWDEQELVFPFYYRLRQRIDEMNNLLEQNERRLYLIPQYAEKSSNDVETIGERQPEFPYYTSKPADRSCKVDLAIIQFDKKELSELESHSEATYWHLEHSPLFMMEFKVRTGNGFLKEAKKDLSKLYELQKRYPSIERVYFCFLSDILPSDERMKAIVKQSGISNLTLCYRNKDREMSIESTTEVAFS